MSAGCGPCSRRVRFIGEPRRGSARTTCASCACSGSRAMARARSTPGPRAAIRLRTGAARLSAERIRRSSSSCWRRAGRRSVARMSPRCGLLGRILRSRPIRSLGGGRRRCRRRPARAASPRSRCGRATTPRCWPCGCGCPTPEARAAGGLRALLEALHGRAFGSRSRTGARWPSARRGAGARRAGRPGGARGGRGPPGRASPGLRGAGRACPGPAVGRAEPVLAHGVLRRARGSGPSWPARGALDRGGLPRRSGPARDACWRRRWRRVDRSLRDSPSAARALHSTRESGGSLSREAYPDEPRQPVRPLDVARACPSAARRGGRGRGGPAPRATPGSATPSPCRARRPGRRRGSCSPASRRRPT